MLQSMCTSKYVSFCIFKLDKKAKKKKEKGKKKHIKLKNLN